MRKSLHNLTGSFKLIDILKPINFKKEVVVILLFLLCYSSSLLGQVQVVTDPTEVMVSLNETFTVTVEVNTDQSVDATEIHMGFDPNIIEVVSVSLPQSNPLPVPIIEADFDNILGTLDYVAGTFSNFPNSNFVFLEIEFIAQALGTTELEFTGLPSKVTYGGSNILSGLSGTNITIIPSGPDSSPTIALIEDVIVTEGSSIEKDIYITDDKNVYNTNIVIYDKSNGGSNSPFLPSTTVSENNYSLLDNGNGNYTFNWNTVLGDGRSYLAEVTTDDGVNLPVKQTFTIDIAQKIPSDILARTFTNPLPWYKSTSDTPPVAPFTVAIEDNAAQNVGYLDPADYIEYLIDVPAPGEYDIELLAAKGNNGATMVSISEENNNSYSTIGTFNVIKTAWQVYNSYSTTVTFTNAGLQTIRFDFDGGVNIKNFIVSQSQITACNTAFRVNAGGPLFGLTGGDFEADQSANQAGGTAETGTPSIYYKGAIDKTFGSNAPLVSNNTGYPDVIFQTERHIEGGTLMNWEFPANGTYEVDLLFNENWTGENANPRVFDVEIEGDLVLDDYRPSVAAGGVNIAKVETFTVEVEDGIMNIDFIQGTQNPSIKGFSICLISEPDNTAPIVTINSPSEGNTLVRGMNVDLIGTALDSEDGDISDSINWSSNDTRFTTMPLNGIGSNINGMFVTPGIQTLTASVSDSDSESSSSEIEIEVSGPAVSIVAPLDSEELYSTNVRLEWSGTDVLFDLTEHYHLYINPPDISNIDTATRISTASQIGQEFWELNELDGIVEGLNTIVVVVADPTHAEFVNSEAKDVINFTVSLQDVTSPIITLLDTDPLQIELGSPYINLGASASDDLDGDLTDEIIIGGDVVDVNTIGNYIITYNVLDEAGNLATEVTQTVTVSDNVAPIITCPADIITSTTQGICGVNLNISGISAIDLSDEITYESTRSDGLLMSEPYSLGETTITWTALDASGNMSESCVQTITVTDEVGPGFDCPVNISATSLNGNPMVLEIVTPSVFDSCSELDVILTSTRNDGLELDDAFPVGETQIEWKALDNANNLISCIQTVTVNYAGSSENTIVFFSFEEQSEPEIIDYSSGTVEISVVAGTDLTTLEPNFGISSNASVNPNLGDVMDFTNPVNYTVTAEDGSQKIWTIVVKVDDDNNHLSINAFTLINADTGQDIMILIEGQLINAANYVNTNLAIRADTSSDVGSVQLMLSGDKTKNQTESLAPFSLYGDDVLTGDYGGELFAIGSYTITATPYINAGLTGEQGETKSVNFQFIDQDPICINFDASIANKVNPSGCNNNDSNYSDKYNRV
ncbi:malectin domain-containing carbohydrate-binding protein [Maribacter sp.]|uniref:malectin domain-containing carbohydrate-binding protein n=1 Tax=Maribacter sp. TaxID=1897614 RepID=UPI003296D24A